MIKTDDERMQKSDDAKGEATTRNGVQKEADEAAKKSQRTEQRFDRENNIFTK